jgi:hypothetical protein
MSLPLFMFARAPLFVDFLILMPFKDNVPATEASPYSVAWREQMIMNSE